MPYFTAKPAAELIIRRPDGTESRFVRPKERRQANKGNQDAALNDQCARLVLDCPPYTASFNDLLENTAVPATDAQRFVSLVHDRMLAESIPLNTRTYNALMKLVVTQQDGVIFALYEELKTEAMKENGSVLPDLETFRTLFHACERGALYRRAFLLYQQMRDLFHLLPETSTYNALLEYCAAVNDVAQATYFVTEMKENHVELDVNTYNCLISALVDAAPYEETLRVFHEMSEYQLCPTVRTYNTVLKAARVHDDYDRAFQLFEEMKKKGLMPDILTYNTLLWICEQRVDYVLGQGRYAGSRRTREQRQHGKSAVAELGLTLLSEMGAMGVVPNTFTYNKVLAILLACEDHRIFGVYRGVVKAYDDEAAATGEGAAGRDGLGTAGNGHARQSRTRSPVSFALPAERSPRGVAAGGLRTESSIRAAGVRPLLETYKIMLQACLSLSHSNLCRELYDSMHRYKLRADKEAALLLLRLCARQGDREWAETVMTEVRADKLFVGTALYNAYMSVLAAVATSTATTSTAAATKDDTTSSDNAASLPPLDGDAAMTTLLERFEQMRLGINEFGVRADCTTYNIILKAHIDRGELDEAATLLATMQAVDASVAPDDETYCLLIDLCALRGDVEQPTAVIEDCIRKEVPLGVGVFCRLMRMYASLHDARIADVFTRLAHAAGGAVAVGTASPRSATLPCLNLECYSIYMQYLLQTRQHDKMLKLFNELKVSSVLEPDTTVYNLVLQMYSDRGEHKAIIALFDDVRMHGIQPDIAMYNIILAAFLDTGHPFLFDVLADMQANNIPPADSTLALFLTNAQGRRLLTEAMNRNLFYKPAGFLNFAAV